MKAPGTALVTGATSGIGRWIALGLARAGYRVVLVGRDRARGEATCRWIEGEVPGAETHLLLADLSLLGQTRRLAGDVGARFGDLSLLVLNAGTFTARREETREGHERVLATNHLSAFVLTAGLEERLRSNAPARIVVTGSSTSDRAGIDPGDLPLRRGWNMVRAYGRSKLALMMTSFEWAERLKNAGVTVNVVHPGAVATGLVRTPGIIGWSWRRLGVFFRSEEEGAATPLHACLSPEFGAATGTYLKDRRAVAPNRRALDQALRRRVWTETERLVSATAATPPPPPEPGREP